ncbi:MAG TPA: ATP-binding protein [Spirochaetota bacterium]|nr:ATP-binding protein [Spirochaetota bacterium]HOS33081.1 ATP-binding protein [Spirochaetota bacterium]HOS56336.1 ATP-binding protein [Spirochaetota bacterium]HPK62313.1 ATP-binding protein [Spirochaetota bacterium]HQF78778.1 ATP-binding protein [Spirochaetota bacterium]
MSKNRLIIKIRLKLFLLLVVFSSIPLFLIFYFSQSHVFKYLFEQNKEYYFSILSQNIKNFEKKNARYKRALEELKSSSDFRYFLEKKITDEKDELEIINKISSLKNGPDNEKLFYKYINENIGDLALIHLDDKSRLNSEIRIDNFSQKNAHLNARFIQNNLNSSFNSGDGGELIFSKISESITYEDSLETKYGYYHKIFKGGAVSKLILIFLDKDAFAELFKINDSIGSYKMYILDKNDELLWSNDKISGDERYRADFILLDYNIVRIINKIDKYQNSLNSKKYLGLVKYNKSDFMIFSDIELKSQTKFLLLIPFKNVTSSIEGIIKAIFTILLILIAVIVVSSVLSSAAFSKKIEEKAEVLQGENLYFMNLAHETKTPLTLVSNYLDEFVEQNGDSRELSIIKENFDKIKSDMISFLDVGKLDRGQEFYDHNYRLNLSEFVEKKIGFFKILSGRRGVNISANIEKNVFIGADRFAMDRVLNNLLDNAIKYSKDGGKVEVILTKDQTTARLIIADDGIGIPKNKIKRIFKPFSRIQGAGASTYGVGIGLFIVKKIVESINGYIVVDSEEGKYTKFIIRVPLAQESIGEFDINTTDSAKYFDDIDKNSQIRPNLANILIVEDNIELLEFMKNKLALDYNVYAETGVERALNKLAGTQNIELIISDVIMGERNGFELFQEIKKIDKLRDVPFIFLSALNSLPERLKGLDIGAIDYISKPFSIEELKAKIRSILNFNRMKRALYEKDKYASLGMLLGGISHEIFNPLSGIYGPLENIEKIIEGSELKGNEKINIFIGAIYKNIERIENIIKSLKTLFYNKEFLIEEVDIRKLIDSILEVLSSGIKSKNIKIKVSIDDKLKIFANNGVLSQIMLNLISNSIDASSNDGNIEIKAEMKKNIKIISVKDSGSGISEENLPNIFNAFFSTKEIGKGMGLGLYIVKDLVIKMGWSIDVESEVGVGTTFTIQIENINENIKNKEAT